jgi:hypothetical protein
MNDKTISGIMKRHFKKLEAMEKVLEAQIMASYDALLSQMIGIIISWSCDVDGNPRNPGEFLPGRHPHHIASGARLAGLELPRIDELHRMTRAEALRTELRIGQARQAKAAGEVVEANLAGMAGELWETLSEHFSLSVKAIPPDVLKAVISDEAYPIFDTLRHSHTVIADRASTMVWQGLAQGKPLLNIVNQVSDYMRRTTKQAFDIVSYYEDTRVSAAVAVACLAEAGIDHFRTRCMHDGKACEVCLAIEEEQASNPPAISEAVPGMNCPPFHPWCRCWVDIVSGKGMDA